MKLTRIPSKKIQGTLHHFPKLLLVLAIMFLSHITTAQQTPTNDKTMEVGVARINITPDGPIRLAGYASRKKTESEGIMHQLEAKALAFGSDAQEPSILITVDLVSIPGHITTELADQLSEKIGMDPAQLVICASHTHGGPEVGNLMNILQYRGETFSDSLLMLDQLVHITQYITQLSKKLEQVALDAMKDRKPAYVAWGQGQAGFAKNRRTLGGPVDPSLPILRVTDPEGNLRALLVNYACHGTTLGGEINQIHGDWMSEAQQLIEANHPGAVALIAIGCGADANPDPRGQIEDMRMHGQEIAKNADKLLTAQLQPLSIPPVGHIQWIELPFDDVPTIPELIEQTKDPSVKGYYARLALDRIARGHAIPNTLPYPVQTWTFGDKLAMINLAGEVVVDYSVRLKNELGAERLWINAYSNDVPCYIASRRVIREGGYEAESSMYYYDKPSPLAEEAENLIVEAVHELLPASYKEKRAATNHLEVVQAENNGSLHLNAELAQAIGPEIEYMPEWKAFGWFTADDQVEWEVEVDEKGTYEVYLEWSVSDTEAGKPFVFEAGKQKLTGTVGKTGSWFTYKTEKIGKIRLASGHQKMVFKPASDFDQGAILDLRAIKLIPVK